MKVLVTGAAGFIGTRIRRTALACCDQLVGRDDLNEHFARQIKPDRTPHLADKVDSDLVRFDFGYRCGVRESIADSNLYFNEFLADLGAVHQPLTKLTEISKTSAWLRRSGKERSCLRGRPTYEALAV